MQQGFEAFLLHKIEILKMNYPDNSGHVTIREGYVSLNHCMFTAIIGLGCIKFERLALPEMSRY